MRARLPRPAAGRRTSALVLVGVLGAAALTQVAAFAAAGVGVDRSIAATGTGTSAASPSSVPTITETPSPGPASHPPTPPSGASSVAQQPQGDEPVASPSASPDQAVLQRGQQLFGSGCAGCHGQRGEGTALGPDLRTVGPASTDFQLSTGRMPLATPDEQPQRHDPAYSRDDIQALVAYVDSLGPGGVPIPTVQPGNATSGRTLYLANCASCHSSTGVGAALPAGQVAPALLSTPSRQVAEAVRVGPGLMPAFSDQTLSDRQLDDLVSYVRSLDNHESAGGWSAGGVGPAAEGLVGWAVGLGALLVVIRLLGKRAPR